MYGYMYMCDVELKLVQDLGVYKLKIGPSHKFKIGPSYFIVFPIFIVFFRYAYKHK